MTDRIQVQRIFAVGARRVTITAYEQIGCEDCYSMLLAASLHRVLTGEDVVPPIDREVKDSMIRQNVQPYSDAT
jgi:hypothetical protein